jgi:hypothetical protein
MHLYRELVPEEREPELQLMMGDPAIEGVYEAQLPQARAKRTAPQGDAAVHTVCLG